MNEMTYRVYNRCKHDIGVQLMNGMHYNIKAGSFRLMTATDILYVESICRDQKFFSARMLVATTADGKEVPFEEIGLSPDPDVVPHMNDEEIAAMLKKSVKQVEAWLEDMTDPAELHAVYLVAKDMDLNASKLKILNAKVPAKDWLEG